MSQRFFVERPINSPQVLLSREESHHLARVMRIQPGDEVTLFDGSGAEFTARVEAAAKRSVGLTILSRREVERELPVEIVLGAALPKGDRQGWLIEKAVELGVARFVPLRTERGVAQPTAGATARLSRAAIEAAKQCGRNRLMRVEEPMDWRDFAAAAPESACRLAAHPGAEPLGRVLGSLSKATESVWGAVGPEGGFCEEECAVAGRLGWRQVGLGPTILRTETAAISLAAAAATWASANVPAVKKKNHE